MALPRERPAEREAESGCEQLWIHRDGNAAALVAIEVELPADRSRPDAGLRGRGVGLHDLRGAIEAEPRAARGHTT